MTLTKEMILAEFRRKVGTSSGEVKDLLEIILEELKTKLEEGSCVKIANFGKWEVKSKGTRTGRNPNTGEPMQIAARRVVTFQPSEKLRTSMNGAMA